MNNNQNSNTKVIVGMSGGVDSSVAALLLLRQGYTVEGLFMKNWEEDDTNEYCAAAEDLKDVESVCNKLGIKLNTINFSAEYWDNVFSYFLEEYKAGRTPNPDILCNKEIKFKAALEYVKELGGDYFATGHYAKKIINEDGSFELAKPKDLNKDQTYFLYTLTQDRLAKALFPLENLDKPEIRNIAEENGFINHAKKDSTGICFIGERKFKTFLEGYLPNKPGNIVTEDKTIIGKHDGLMYYTLGQRQGLGIGGVANAPEKPWYVAKKDLERNELIVVQGKDHPSLYSKKLKASSLSFVNNKFDTKKTIECSAKVRYRQTDMQCFFKFIDNDSMEVEFYEPVFSITPGQSIVFYNNEICLGGGIIEEVYE